MRKAQLASARSRSLSDFPQSLNSRPCKSPATRMNPQLFQLKSKRESLILRCGVKPAAQTLQTRPAAAGG